MTTAATYERRDSTAEPVALLRTAAVDSNKQSNPFNELLLACLAPVTATVGLNRGRSCASEPPVKTTVARNERSDCLPEIRTAVDSDEQISNESCLEQVTATVDQNRERDRTSERESANEGLGTYEGELTEVDDLSETLRLSNAGAETEKKLACPTPVASVSRVIDAINGGECKIGNMTLFVPPGAVTSPTAISADIFVDKSAMPPVAEGQIVLSSVLQLSPSGLSFQKPVQLSFPPNVQLKAMNRENGCHLKLQMTNSLLDDRQRQWHSALEMDTVTGDVIQPLQDVRFDSHSGQVELRRLIACGWTGTLLAENETGVRRVLYAAFGKKLESHEWIILLYVIDCAQLTYQSIVEARKKNNFICLTPPIFATIYGQGKVSLQFDFDEQWQPWFGGTRWESDVESISGCKYHALTVKDTSQSAKFLSFTVRAECHSTAPLLEALAPTTLIVAHPLEDSSMKPSSPKHDMSEDYWHFVEDQSIHPNPKPLMSQSSEPIGMCGGKLKTKDFTLTVPEAAVSTATTFSVQVYVDPRVMPPVNRQEEEVILTPVYFLSSTPTSKLNTAIRMELQSEVRHRRSGWGLELKRSSPSDDGLPHKWDTLLKLNTSTGELIYSERRHSVTLDRNSANRTVRLNRTGMFFAWTGKPVSSAQLRQICYVLYGREIKKHKWSVRILVMHGTWTVSRKAVESILKDQQYIKLADPHPDHIDQQGVVEIRWKPSYSWQVCDGEKKAKIAAENIWYSQLDKIPFTDIILEDTSCTSRLLEVTVEVSFVSENDQCEVQPVRLHVKEPITGVSAFTAKPASQQFQKFARRVRRNGNKLGGFWKGCTDIPVQVKTNVCNLIDNSSSRYATDFAGGLTGKRTCETKSAHEILESWVDTMGDNATLEYLFGAMFSVGKMDNLKRQIERRIKEQSTNTDAALVDRGK